MAASRNRDTWFDRLPVLGSEGRCAKPKYAEPSKLAAKTAARKADVKALAAWKRAIWKRDKGLCRCCKVAVRKSLELHEKRGECHHIEGRANHDVRYDVRNGVLLCAKCHERVERWELRIEGVRAFVVNQRAYFDADRKLKFIG